MFKIFLQIVLFLTYFLVTLKQLIKQQQQNTKTMTNLKPKRIVNARLYRHYYPTQVLQSRLEWLVFYINQTDANISYSERNEMTLTIRELLYELADRKNREQETGKTWDMQFANEEEIEELRDILKKQYNPALR